MPLELDRARGQRAGSMLPLGTVNGLWMAGMPSCWQHPMSLRHINRDQTCAGVAVLKLLPTLSEHLYIPVSIQ